MILRQEPGIYRTRSRSQPGRIWAIYANRVWHDDRQHVEVRCNCPGGKNRIDKRGNSTCYHAQEVMQRLLDMPNEIQDLPEPA